MLQVKKLVRVIDGCKPDNIPQFVLDSKEPLILKGLVADWPIVKSARESFDSVANYLKKFYRGSVVNAAYGPSENNGRIFYNKDFSGFNYERKKTRLDILLDEIHQFEKQELPPVFYMDSTLIDNCLPDFRKENDLVIDNVNPRVSIWVGNKTRVPAHYDALENIACVVAGRRRFTLFPPDQLENLYVGPLDFNPAGQSISLVDFHNPDYEKFPKFRAAVETAKIAELELGDALFLPAMWWHHVEGLEDFNILVNYWWNPTPGYLGLPVDALTHALLSIKELPDDKKKIWQNIFDYYVFNTDANALDHIPKEKLGILNKIDEANARRIRAMLLNRLNC